MWLFGKSKPEIQSIIDTETEEQVDDLTPPLPPDDYYKKSRVLKSNRTKGKIVKKAKQTSRPDKIKSETGVDKEKITCAEKLNQEILRIKNELEKLEQGRIN